MRFAEEDGGERTLPGWRDAVRAAYAAGRFTGSPKLTVTVINRARRVASALPPVGG